MGLLNYCASILLAFVVVFITRIIFKYFIKPYFLMREFKHIKGAACLYRPLLGIYSELRRSEKLHGNPYYMTNERLKQNPNMRMLVFPFMNKIMIELQDPDLVREFYSKQHLIEKDLRLVGVVSEFNRRGIVFSEEERWKLQRKLLAKIFHFDYMNSCLPKISKVAKIWMTLNCQDPQSTVDVLRELKHFTGRIIWQLFFGDEIFGDEAQAKKDIFRMLDNVVDSRCYFFDPLTALCGPEFYKLGLRALDRRYKADNAWIEAYCKEKFEICKKKYLETQAKGIASENRSKTLIELLVEASLTEGEDKITDEEHASQIRAILMTGTDTTGNALSLAHYYLAQYPEMQEKAREEVRNVIGDAEEITYAQLSKLEYMTAFIKECLRMYGPAPQLFPRVAKEDFMLGEARIRKGYNVNVALHGICHNSKYFSNPNEFRPERWIEKQDIGVTDPFAYTPFSSGPRKCLAEHLAYIEAKLLLAELLRRYKIDIKRPYELKVRIGVLLETVDLQVIYTDLKSK